MSPAARALLEALRERAQGRRRLRIEQAWEALYVARPGTKGDTDARGRLAGLLEELREAGAVRLPAPPAWDHRTQPPLPRTLTLAALREASAEDLSVYPWVPELRFVLELKRTPALSDLRALNRFFAQGGGALPLVPTRERSLRIFGDEKRLDALSSQAWFTQLGLERLRCFDVPAPLVREWGPKGGPVLVLENLHTWHSFARWNADRGVYSAVCYGAGRAVERAGEELLGIRSRAEAAELLYFGDLDPEGLRIPTRLAEAWPALGLAPARRWYALLLEQGVVGPCEDRGEVEAGLTWLGGDEAIEARAMFARGERMAQEGLGWVEISGTS